MIYMLGIIFFLFPQGKFPVYHFVGIQYDDEHDRSNYCSKQYVDIICSDACSKFRRKIHLIHPFSTIITYIFVIINSFKK